MIPTPLRSAFPLLLLCALPAATLAAGAPAPPDSARIESLTGARGHRSRAAGEFRVTAPRGDLDVRHTGMEMTPALGLESVAVFSGSGAHARVTADLCATPDQVNPVLGAALDAGLEVQALEQRFLWEEPKVLFLTVSGTGDETRLATAVGRLFAKLADQPAGRPDVPLEDMDPLWTGFDTKRIDQVLQATGTLANGVYRVTVPRASIAFAGSDDRAVAEGQLTLERPDLQDVLRLLRSGGIYIAAIHRAPAGDAVAVNFWGQNTTESLARVLRRALDHTS